MKILVILLSIITLCGCASEKPMEIKENLRAVMVEGKIYYDTGLAPSLLPKCGTMDGEVTASVAEDELPKENGQSNFGTGYGYQNYDRNEIIVLTGTEDWSVFRCEDEWGITMSVKDVTPKGLMLVIDQRGGNVKGELHTGAPFTVEELKEGAWQELECMIDAWAMPAYSIKMNDVTEFETGWKYVYGELPAGKYRIGKEIHDWVAPGEFEKETYYAEFEIK